MTPLDVAHLAPAIQNHLDMVAEAKKGLATTLAQVQAKCEHRVVGEKPYGSPNYNATRICMHCRLVEVGSHWSGGSVWSVQDHSGVPTLGNDEGRIVFPITQDVLWSLRIAS